MAIKFHPYSKRKRYQPVIFIHFVKLDKNLQHPLKSSPDQHTLLRSSVKHAIPEILPQRLFRQFDFSSQELGVNRLFLQNCWSYTLLQRRCR